MDGLVVARPEIVSISIPGKGLWPLVAQVSHKAEKGRFRLRPRLKGYPNKTIEVHFEALVLLCVHMGIKRLTRIWRLSQRSY